MTTLTLERKESHGRDRHDLLREVLELETRLAASRDELNSMQTALGDFTLRYIEIVGEKMAELAELERQIREMESGAKPDAAPDSNDDSARDFYDDNFSITHDEPTLKHLRKLFWSLAKKFHPDQSATEEERTRRHEIMSQASQAYKQGDEDLLAQMLSDGTLELHCVTARGAEAEEEKRDGKFLLRRRDELLDQIRTIEYGIRRTRINPLYKLKLETEREEARGRKDALADQAARLAKRIKQARLRLEQLELGVV